jgi:hypothetical protein
METIILINDEDRKEGFFTVSTSKITDFQKLCRRIGGEDKLISLETCTQARKITEWICKVPIEFFNTTNFSIGKKRQVNLSPEQKAVMAERLKEARKKI